LGRSAYIPNPTTGRSVLRPSTWEDLDKLARISADPQTCRFMRSGPVSREEIAQNIRGWVEEYGRGPGFLAVIYEGKLTGRCGLGEEDGGIGVGYMLHKDCWGIGLATEAATAVVEYGFDALGLERIWASARAENRASRRVMEKLGMPLQKSEHHEAGEEAHYAVSRWEFRARPSSQAGFRKGEK